MRLPDQYVSDEGSYEGEREAKYLPKWHVWLVAERGDQHVVENEIEGKEARKRAHHAEEDGLHKLAATHDPIGGSYTPC